MNKQYPESVSQLLRYGDCRNMKEWPDYLKLGITRKHIPDLIEILTDEGLHESPSDALELWGPVHAWRALGQLRAEKAIEPMLSLLHKIDDENDDWVAGELPLVLGMIGAEAIPFLAAYLENGKNPLFAHVAAARALAVIGDLYKKNRDKCVSVLTKKLEAYEKNDTMLNGILINFLTNLKAIESVHVVQKAFGKNCVDLQIMGDFDDFKRELGLQDIKIRRNSLCFCGSGKKYKKCCLNK